MNKNNSFALRPSFERIVIMLAASTMIHDDPELADYRTLDAHDRALLIRDYRDEFASSPAPLLAAAKLDDTLIFAIRDLLDAAL